MQFDDQEISVQGSVVDFSKSSQTLSPSDYQKLMQLSAAEVVAVSDLTEVGKRSDAFQLFTAGTKEKMSLVTPILLGVGGVLVGVLLFRRSK